jgi:hypothetical protein
MKTKLMIAICAASMAITGCGHNPLSPTKTELVVARPGEAYFICDKVSLPDPASLTDVEIAQLINDLVKANRICANNMAAIKQFLDAAEQVIEQRKN